jgi:hypothetical protein
MGTSTVNLSSADVEIAPPSSGGGQTPSLSSSDVEIEGAPQQQGPVNPYANDMSNVPGAVPGMQTPEQAAGQKPWQQPVEKASTMDVLMGASAPPATAETERIRRAVDATRQYVHGPETAEQQTAAVQSAIHPSTEQTITSMDPQFSTIPYGISHVVKGVGTAASGVRAGDWSKAARGGTEAIGGAAQAGSLPMGVAIANAPIRMAIGYAEGLATGAGAKAIAQKLNLTPDEVEFANAAGFFAPMAYHTAIGLELTQEQQGTVNRVRASAFGGRVQGVAATSPDSVGVAGQVGPFKFGWARARGNPNVDFSDKGPTTGIGEGPEPPEAAGPVQSAPRPPVPGSGGAPKFFLQTADPAGVVTPRLISQIAGLVQGAPQEMRADLATQAHEQTAQQALAKGSILAANGKTIPITSPDQARQVVGNMFASVGLPRPAPPAPPDAVTVQQQAQSQTITEVASSAASINKQAAQIVGLAPPPPPPPKPGDPGSKEMPMPTGMNDGMLTQDTVNKAGAAIQALPPAIRPHAILEATGNLAKWLFGQKTAIGPDGKVVNVDSQKAAQTTAVKIINDEVDRQTEQAKATQETQQKAIQERQDNAKQAQEERDQAIAPEEKKPAEKSTGLEQPVEIPDTPATRKAAVVLAAAPMEATAEQLDSLIRRTATVTAGVRKRLVEREIQKRANRQEDHAQAGMMGEPIAPGQSREELQRWTDAVVKGEHPYVHVPAASEFKPAGVENLARTQVKGAGPFSGTYYHAKEISPADIRKAARDKTNAQGALDALTAKWKGESPAAEQKPVELKAEDVETEAGTAGSKEPQEGEGITSAPGAQPVSSPSSEEPKRNISGSESPITKSAPEVALSEPVKLPPEAATGLTVLVDDHASTDPTATLDDVLRHKDTGNFIAQALVNDGIITNSADNVNPKTGLLTTSAKAKVGDALLAELLPPAVIEQTPKFLKQKLLGTMGAIKAIQSAGEGWNLQDQIVAATERYGQIFRGQDTYEQGPVIEAILKKLDEPIDKVRAAFSSFAVAATNHDPSDKPFFDFNLAFGTELTPEQYAAGLKPAEKPIKPEPVRVSQHTSEMALMRADSTPMLDIHREPTGWLKVEHDNGTVLVHPYENEMVYFNGEDRRSGADALRAKAEAQAYAIDNPVEPKPAGPAGELIIKPIFKREEAKPLAKGDKVTYRTNKGKERTGEVAWTDGKKVRITDNGSTVNKNIEDVKHVGQPSAVVDAARASESQPSHTESSAPEVAADATLVDALQLKFEHGAGPKNYNDLKKIVTEFDGEEPDQIRMKESQEAYEAMLNRVASEIVNKNSGGAHEVFDRLTRLYEGQPNLSIRTSTSIANQAYSTPLPLAFIADKFAGITWNTTTVYEPTAGNGALLIAANPKMTQANELNPARADTLRDEGFPVTQNDATVWGPAMRFDAVVANPPFGPLAGPVKVDGYNVVKLDHLIIAKALGAMKDAGKAAIIIAAGDREKPGEITNQVRPFFNWLYAHYNVVSDFELEGDLYSRQGASFPVRMIAIDGRVRSAKVSPDAAAIPRLKTWREVYDKAAEHLGTNLAGQRPADNVAGGPVRDESADTGAVSRTATGRNRPTDSGEPEAGEARTGSDGGTEPQPGPIAHSGRVASPRVGSPDSTVRPDGDVARSDRLAEGQPASRTVRRGTAEPDGHSANALADESNQFQASYHPHSSKQDVAVMAPKALIDPMQTAMDRIADEVGDIDQWVTDQLGYPDMETMHEAFMGIQTDAIAAAIYQMQRGKALINADQTGVGKGRVAAAMIRWAELHGHVPIFVTESAPLFSPMYADLQDIGSGQTISPLLFNADASITDPKTGTKIFQNPGAMRPVLDRIRETGELPKGRNAVFLTYSQINTDNRQQLTLHRIAPNAIFILDESHNAGGDSNTGNFLSELLTGSKGVVFLSATWAKRPDNLPLYAGMTDISTAIPDRALVADAITAGGAPLQAVLTSLLAETGQFVRRERSFDGIDIKNVVDEKNEAEHTRISDKVTEVLRGIVKADALFHNLDFARIQKEAKRKGGGAQSKGVVVQHMEFSSIVHNLVKQLLLALKADTAANEIIASIERGEKPVFALENTMGAFLDSYIQGHNLSEGDSLAGLDYSRISDRALMRTRYYNEIDEQGNKNRVEVPLDDLSPQVREAYDETQALIDALQVDLPVSPIDYIRNKVEKAGYKIAEITGRNWRIDYSGDVPKLATVPGIERKDRVNTATQFNNGGLDALIINRAGSTGISLHAGEKFRDQRPRHMIVGQPAGDVNIVMQILGRVNRTGQMVLPKYTMLAAALPAEQRPAINLAKKMKSLNANVSSNTRAATSVKAVDLMNKYGDKIVAQYLWDNPEMARLLGLKADTNEKGEPTGNEGLAMKATGHSALLPVSQQQEFMDSISEAYTNYIDFLDETGQNDLEPRTYDFAARETHIERMYQGVDPTSPFGQDAHYGEYSIKRQGKPFTPEEVMEKIADTFGPAAMQLPPRERDTRAARDLAAHFEELYKPYLAGLTTEGAVERAQQMRTRGRQLLSDYRVSTGVRIELNGEQYNGVITNIEGAKKPSGNPYAPSALQLTIAVNSGLRQTKVPGSQMDALVTSNLGRNADVRQLFKDYGSDRQKAKIITGNLLGAYGELKTGAKGRIISFTMDDGTTKLGILMPSKFDIKSDVNGTYAMRTPEGALSFLETGDAYLQSSGQEIGVVGPSNRREGYEIRTKTSKSAAGKFFLDPKLLDTVQGGEFASSNGLMKATIKEGRELDALKAIMGKISLYANPEHIEEARKHDEKAKEELDKPKVPKRAKGSVTMSFLGMGALDPLATKLLQPVVDYVNGAIKTTLVDDIAKPLSKTVAGAGYEIAATFFPTILANTKALNAMDRATGTVAWEMYKATNALEELGKLFDKMQQKDWVEFVDRIQNPKNPNYGKQETETLQQAQELITALLDAAMDGAETAVNLGRTAANRITFPRKADYFPNRWDRNHRPKKEGAEPDDKEKEIDQVASIWNNASIGKRPLAPRNFLKKQSWTLREGIEHGGRPIGNPVVMALRSLEEKVKFATAHEMKYQAQQAGLLKFRRRGTPMPPNFERIPDPLMKVWRLVDTAEGGMIPVETGEWVMAKDAARLLNNYLSTDVIRSSSLGTVAMNIKTSSTMAKFGFGIFHYFTIPFWATVTGFQTAGELLWNQGVRGLDIAKALEGTLEVPKTLTGLAADVVNTFMASLERVPKLIGKPQANLPQVPYGTIYRGGKMLQYAKDLDSYLLTNEGTLLNEANSDFAHMQYLLFVGGLRWGMNDDFRLDGPSGFLAQLKDHHVGKAIWAATKGTLRMIAHPLMLHYIPRMKWVVASHLLAMKLNQYSEALAAGTITEETLARQVVTTIEDRFGEVNYARQYLNNTVKSAIQLAFLAPGWKGGTWDTMVGAMVEAGLSASEAFDMARWATEKITGQPISGKTTTSNRFDDRMRDRFGGGGKGPGGAGGGKGGSGGGNGGSGGNGGGGNGSSGKGFGEFSSRLPQIGMRAGAVLSTLITAALLSVIITKLLTGKWPWEFIEEDKKKLGLNDAQAAALELAHSRVGGDDLRGNPLRLTFPTDLRDIEHIFLDPKGYAKGAIAVPWRSGAETLMNRNWRDNYVINPADDLKTKLWQGVSYNLVNDYEPISVDQFSQNPSSDAGLGKKLLSATGLLHGVAASENRSAAVNLELSMRPHRPLTPEQEYAYEHHTKDSTRTAARTKNLDELERIFKTLSYTDAKAVYDDPKTTAAERTELKPFLDKKRTDTINSARRK